jgi:hypothetical protein
MAGPTNVLMVSFLRQLISEQRLSFEALLAAWRVWRPIYQRVRSPNQIRAVEVSWLLSLLTLERAFSVFAYCTIGPSNSAKDDNCFLQE